MSIRQPKHQVIFETLRKQITEGKFANARRLPSEMEVAQRHGVSRPTAARAIKDLQRLGLLDRRAGSGTYLRPPQSRGATATMTFGLLVEGLGNTEILDPICNEITQAAQGRQAAVLWGDGQGGIAQEGEDHTATAIRLCAHYIDRKVAGVFFAPLEAPADRAAINAKLLADLRAAGIAVVLLDRDATEYPQRSDCDLVGIDNFAAGLTLAQHVIEQGHRRLVFIARPHPPGTTDLRIAGCRETMARASIQPIDRWCRQGDPADVEFVRSVMKSNRPDAIICSNDRTAALLIQSLTQLGMSVPGQLGVAGFDDVRYATLLAAPLTTMRQPCRDIAQAAVQQMFERIAQPTAAPRQILLNAELIVRRSCTTKLS